MKKIASWGAAGLTVAGIAAFSLPTAALGLNVGAQYEMVSPVYKGGYGAPGIVAVAPSGEKVLYYSTGAFEGAPSGPEGGWDYVARRGAEGWATAPLMVPATLTPYFVGKDVSPTADTVLEVGKPGASQETAFQTGTEEEVLLHATDSADMPANWEVAGDTVFRTFPEKPITLKYLGASADFCHVFLVNVATGHDFLTPEEPGVTADQVYDFDRGCNGQPATLRRLGLNNRQKSISPSCTVQLGVQANDRHSDRSTFNAVADGGREVFFTACVGDESGPKQLFVRLDGTHTLEVSKPLTEGCAEVPCKGAEARASAYFIGAAEDGSLVYFTTAAPLDSATDKDAGNDLYMAKIGCPPGQSECAASKRIVTALVHISQAPGVAEGARVLGVSRIAQDGSRVYFVAQARLVANANAEGHTPQEGAANLYVYDSKSETTKFVAALCTGEELSASVVDQRCQSAESDRNLWGENGAGEEQAAGRDGRFLVFATFAQLTKDDADRARDIYRYDALTERLARVSRGENGYHGDGNDGSFNASIAPGHWGQESVQYQYELDARAVSEDGSKIVFTTSEPLSPTAAASPFANAYEWRSEGGREGVSLISGGSAEEPVETVVISGQGNDVFFVTVQGLVAQDTDGAPDVYDVHTCSSQVPCLTAPATTPERCVTDACYGPLTNPAPLLVPGSAQEEDGEGATSNAHKVKKARRRRHGSRRPKKKRQRRRKARRG